MQKKWLVSIFLLWFSLLYFPQIAFAEDSSREKGWVAFKKGQFDIALREWRLQAEKGEAMAQFNLGGLYRHGRGVLRNMGEALKWYRRAAGQGLIQAQLSLGNVYLRGLGVEANIPEALKWYILAAEQGNVLAQFLLGRLYAQGHKVLQDYEKAARWYRLAAKQKYAPAQYNLAVMYAKGLGFSQDNVEAYKWVGLAAENGSKAGARLKTTLTQFMDSDEMTRAEKALSNCLKKNATEC